MERGQLTETYRILKNSKWNGLKQETKTALVDDMAMIRPIAKDFEESLNDAREKMKPEGFEEMIEHLNQDKEGKRKMEPTERLSVNRALQEYQRQLDKFASDKLNEKVEVDLKQIGFDEINVLCDNNELKGGDIECLQVLIKR